MENPFISCQARLQSFPILSARSETKLESLGTSGAQDSSKNTGKVYFGGYTRRGINSS